MQDEEITAIIESWRAGDEPEDFEDIIELLQELLKLRKKVRNDATS